MKVKLNTIKDIATVNFQRRLIDYFKEFGLTLIILLKKSYQEVFFLQNNIKLTACQKKMQEFIKITKSALKIVIPNNVVVN